MSEQSFLDTETSALLAVAIGRVLVRKDIIQKADIETELKMISNKNPKSNEEFSFQEAIQKAVSVLKQWPSSSY
ncbi:hypothetical protein ACQY1H_18430 [Agrobacterium vitis]|uniref:hypothetical protein n=1 Tax=Agrobacterium vitis TaxID=373 RepID=UPI003D2CEE90